MADSRPGLSYGCSEDGTGVPSQLRPAFHERTLFKLEFLPRDGPMKDFTIYSNNKAVVAAR